MTLEALRGHVAVDGLLTTTTTRRGRWELRVSGLQASASSGQGRAVLLAEPQGAEEEEEHVVVVADSPPVDLSVLLPGHSLGGGVAVEGVGGAAAAAAGRRLLSCRVAALGPVTVMLGPRPAWRLLHALTRRPLLPSLRESLPLRTYMGPERRWQRAVRQGLRASINRAACGADARGHRRGPLVVLGPVWERLGLTVELEGARLALAQPDAHLTRGPAAGGGLVLCVSVGRVRLQPGGGGEEEKEAEAPTARDGSDGCCCCWHEGAIEALAVTLKRGEAREGAAAAQAAAEGGHPAAAAEEEELLALEHVGLRVGLLMLNLRTAGDAWTESGPPSQPWEWLEGSEALEEEGGDAGGARVSARVQLDVALPAVLLQPSIDHLLLSAWLVGAVQACCRTQTTKVKKALPACLPSQQDSWWTCAWSLDRVLAGDGGSVGRSVGGWFRCGRRAGGRPWCWVPTRTCCCHDCG